MYSYAIGITLNVLELMLFFVGAYYTGIALFSLFPSRRKIAEKKMYRYAVVIPAHNEAAVLPALLGSINSVDYPREMISVYVVADGCSDNTEEIAVDYGASVIRRSISSGKGDALKEAFEYIKKEDFDCAAVFDADNIVDKRFFVEINEVIAGGAKVVQAYPDSKNPYASWVANAHSVWYWITNRISENGRSVLNFGCRLLGTGFVITREVLEEVPWQTETVAEDAEYTCMLAINDIKVDYAKRAVVYDEKPITFSESVHQRNRWAKGIRDVQGEYTLKLIKNGKLNALLGLWSDLLYPLTFAVLLIIAVCGYDGIFSGIMGRATLLFYILVTLFIITTALMIDRKLNFKTVLNTTGFILYLISWIPIGLWGIFSTSGNNWYHTKHGE